MFREVLFAQKTRVSIFLLLVRQQKSAITVLPYGEDSATVALKSFSSSQPSKSMLLSVTIPAPEQILLQTMNQLELHL